MTDQTTGLEGLSAEQIQALAATAMQLGNNPKTRKDFQKLVKAANPEVIIPEIEAEDRISALESNLNTKLSEFEKAQRVSEATQRVKEARADMISRKILTADEIPAVEKLMVERGIGDYEAAAVFYRSQNKPAAPTPSALTNFTVPKDELKTLRESGQGGLKKAALAIAYDVANEIQAARGG